MSIAHALLDDQRTLVNALVALVTVIALLLFVDLPGSDLVTVGTLERALQAATPTALTAIGGLYTEKSGVFNIGLEGFMIFGALVGAAVARLLAGNGSITQAHLWVAFVAVAVIFDVLATLFAVLLIRYEANQIVAGLAVWFIGLGFGPLVATVLWGGVSSPSFPNVDMIAVSVLAEIPVLGRLFFDASPLILLTIVVAVAAWAVLFRTRYDYWVQAAGENPEALDTAGIDVNRARYATVVFSGVMAGLGGAVLSIGIGSGFTGTGVTMVDGRGWIVIVAYLFGNYNPLGTYGASLLFGAMDMLQIQLQTIGIPLPGSITGLSPYVAVLAVLVGVDYTRVPSAVGESYDAEE